MKFLITIGLLLLPLNIVFANANKETPIKNNKFIKDLNELYDNEPGHKMITNNVEDTEVIFKPNKDSAPKPLPLKFMNIPYDAEHFLYSLTVPKENTLSITFEEQKAPTSYITNKDRIKMERKDRVNSFKKSSNKNGMSKTH